MTLLIFVVIVVVLLSLAIWAIRLLPIPSPINSILQVVAIVIAIVAIGNRAGVF